MGFRQAEEREDDELAVVLYNAFLPIWYAIPDLRLNY